PAGDRTARERSRQGRPTLGSRRGPLFEPRLRADRVPEGEGEIRGIRALRARPRGRCGAPPREAGLSLGSPLLLPGHATAERGTGSPIPPALRTPRASLV